MEKNKFWAKIAGLPFLIAYCEEEARERYADYEILESDNAISISVTEEKLELTVKEHPEFTRGYNEGACIYQAIGEQLPLYNRLLMHGAAITYEQDGYLFTASSGTGKTTHIYLWKKYLGEKVDIVNGDKPIIHIEDEQVTVCGTPWGGKENWQKNRMVPLKGICFLRQAKKNQITQVEPGELVGAIMQQVYLPNDEMAAAQTLYLLDKLMRMVPIYVLQCDMSEEAVKCSFEKMTGLKMENLQ